MKCAMENALFADCDTDAERAEFFASGRAVATGVIAEACASACAEAFLAKARNHLTTKRIQDEVGLSLAPYCRHKPGCSVNPGGAIMAALGDCEVRPCSCGLDEALAPFIHELDRRAGK